MMSLRLCFVLLSSLASVCVAQVVSEAHLAHNFTLAAINTTLHNSNNTGAPLVLGQAGAVDGAEFFVTSTYASYPFNQFPSLGLVSNSIRAYDQNGNWYTNATEVFSGQALGWLATTLDPPPASQIYSAIRVPSNEFPLLAANGIHNLWSLCPSFGNLPQTNIIFNVSADIPPPPFLNFDPSQCYPVLINMVPIVSS